MENKEKAAAMTASKTPETTPGRKVENVDFRVDLVINDKAEVFVFHALPFKKRLSWLEFNLDNKNLDFIMNDGDVRNFGAKVEDHFAKHMQNAFQVMMVQLDEKTGEPMSGQYFPLIIHRD